MPKSQQTAFPVLHEFAQDGELYIEWAHIFTHPEIFAQFDDALNVIIKMMVLMPGIAKGDRVRLVGKLTIKQIQLNKQILVIVQEKNPKLIKELYRLGNDIGFILRDVIHCTGLLSKASIDALDTFQKFADSMPTKEDGESIDYQEIEKHGIFILAAAMLEILFIEDECKDEECKIKKVLNESSEPSEYDIDFKEDLFHVKQSAQAEII